MFYPKRRYAACPPSRLTCHLSFKNIKNSGRHLGSIFESWGLDFGSFSKEFQLDFRSFPRGCWLDFAVFQQGLGVDFGGFGNSFWIYFGCLGGSGCQVRLGMCFGRLSGKSWSRLGAVLGPKMDQVSLKLRPKQNPIGVLGRLEGSLERPRSVLGASWCILMQFPASHPKKDGKLI